MTSITDLAAAGSVAAGDQLAINQSGTDRRVAADKFAILSAANTFTALTVTPRLRSDGPTSLTNNSVLSFAPNTSSGILIILGNNLATASGIIMYRCGGGSQCALLASSAGTLLATAVDQVLTGTTGVDGKVTISANGADGKIYIENRRGGTTSFSWLEIG